RRDAGVPACGTAGTRGGSAPRSNAWPGACRAAPSTSFSWGLPWPRGLYRRPLPAPQLLPAGIDLLLAALVLNPLLQANAAARAQAVAVRPAQDLGRQGEDEGVAGPGLDVELVAVDVVRAQLVAARRLVVLRGLHGHVHRGVLEAAEARAADVSLEPELQVDAARRALEIERRTGGGRIDDVGLAAHLERHLRQVEGD